MSYEDTMVFKDNKWVEKKWFTKFIQYYIFNYNTNTYLINL